MATMYNSHNGNSAVTHESDDTRPGKALCGRSIVGAINLDTLTPWDRVGLEASSNGPCQNCSVRMQQLSVHPDRALADAYRDGWNRSARPSSAGLEWEEDHYGASHTAAELDAWQAGWIDYASDYAYGTGIRPVAAPTATQETTVTPSVLSAESVADAIHAAMMAANACEATAPQDRAYGILADALKDALSTVYTQEQTNRIYAAVISSGESPSYVISEMPQTQEPVHEVYRVTMADAQGNITDVMPLGTDDVPADHPLNAHLTTAPRGRIVDTGRAARTR